MVLPGDGQDGNDGKSDGEGLLCFVGYCWLCLWCFLGRRGAETVVGLLFTGFVEMGLQL